MSAISRFCSIRILCTLRQREPYGDIIPRAKVIGNGTSATGRVASSSRRLPRAARKEGMKNESTQWPCVQPLWV